MTDLVEERVALPGGEIELTRPRDPREDETALVRHQEEAHVTKNWEGVGHARFGRKVDVNTVRADVPRLGKVVRDSGAKAE